jgi:Sigma-70 factor, region 1.1
MANKTKATPQKEEAREQGPEIPDAVLPLLDLSDAAVTKLINETTKRGYVIYEQLNAVMPLEEITSEQIEDILATRLGPQYAKAILDIMVGNPLDQPSQHFSIGWIGLRLHNARRLPLNYSAR